MTGQQRIKEFYDLVDILRICNNRNKRYTWFCQNPPKTARLDFILYFEELLLFVNKTDIK